MFRKILCWLGFHSKVETETTAYGSGVDRCHHCDYRQVYRSY
ncbi:hypothetical protein FHT76_000040 [Rhizobium sp. BK176]|nr:hypothetical protein [Rhizobium sp. BK176]